jgi:hypothetical protein
VANIWGKNLSYVEHTVYGKLNPEFERNYKILNEKLHKLKNSKLKKTEDTKALFFTRINNNPHIICTDDETAY